jgi:plasmid stabilization system protein ParE
MPLEIILSNLAAEELAEIEEPLFSQIIDRIKLLTKYPYLAPPMDGPFTGCRVLTVGIFRIIYRLVPRRIEILYIRHCRRKLGI